MRKNQTILPLIFISASIFFLFSINDYLYLLGWVLTIIFLYIIQTNKTFRINILDLIILCYPLYELLQSLISINKMPTYMSFTHTYIITIIYLICRQHLNNINILRKLIYYI